MSYFGSKIISLAGRLKFEVEHFDQNIGTSDIFHPLRVKLLDYYIYKKGRAR